MKSVVRIAVVGLLTRASCLAQTKQTDTSTRSTPARLEKMPELLEVRYALSALPPQMSWWNFLPAILLLATVPLSAQTSKPEYLSNSDRMLQGHIGGRHTLRALATHLCD